MTDKQLIKKLGQLRKEEPDENWAILCRQNLVQRIRPASLKEPTTPSVDFGYILSWFRRFSLPRPILRPVVAFTAVFFLIFSGGLFTLAKAKDSLPGDHLFPVKIAIEQVRLLANFSPEQKAQVQSEIMNTRLGELNKVMQQPGPVKEKQQKIAEAVTNLQKQLITVKDQLPNTDNATKAFEAARSVDNSASQAELALNQARATLPLEANQILADKIDEAGETADGASLQALEMMIENQGKDEEGIKPEEIVSKLNDRIQAAEKKISAISAFMLNADNGNSSLPINADLIIDQSKKAQDLLNEAKIALEKNDLAGAFKMIKSAGEMVKIVDRLVQSAGLPLYNQESTDDSGQNASSTLIIDKNTTSDDLSPKEGE